LAKKSFPLARVYTLLEPGPVVLLSTASKGETDVMTLSWQTMLDFEPPLLGCVVSDRNHSFALLKASKECVINIPTMEIARQVVACGNCSGADTDKFKRFGLTARPAQRVGAALIDECYASLECRVVDTRMVPKYGLFVLEVLQAWVDRTVKEPRTLHHVGYGRFRVAGESMKLRSRMR
jgi:flavin reductase (DIM6/NTAB) family NADH-FMN oxidoreductase RutF